MDLNESEERYRLIVDTIMDGFWLADIQGRLLDVNETYCRMSGYGRDELLSMYVYDFDVLESATEVQQHIDTIREKGEVRFESKHRRKDGSIFDVEVGVQFHLVNGGQFISFIRDITERNRRENELYEERNDWENTFDSITDMITIHDINYNIVRSNKAAKEYLGLPDLNRIIGAKCFHYYHGTNNPLKGCPSCDCLKSGLPGIFEMYEPHLKLFLEIRAIPRIDINNQLIGLVHVVRDITDRKKAEKELIKAKENAEESDRLKSAFLANMSHEIRTPMNGILGFAELLKEPKLTGEEQSNYIGVIERGGARMLNVINDIMDISKIESGQMKMSIAKTNINKQIDYLCTFFRPEVQSKGIKLNCTCTLPDAEATINSDKEKIYAILTNLVKNAIKYSNEGSIEFGYEKKGKFLEFFVKDTGIGIADDRQEAIFERFVQADLSDTRAMQGAGLGLTITKAYVEMLGGRIWVESELGKGTAFYFTIPYFLNMDEHISINLNRANDEMNGIKNLNILIAEDDEACEMLLISNLGKFIKNIKSVINGVEAVAAIRNNPDINLIMMDIKMPEMDGYEATREIRKFNKDVVIIAQTAFALAGDMEKSINVGCNDYISKPINNSKLNELIVKYFGGEHRK